MWAFSPDGNQLATASADSAIHLWDLKQHQELAILADHSNWVRQVAYSPDGRQLASASYDQTTKLRDALTGHVLRTLKSVSPVNSVAFSPTDPYLATGTTDGQVNLHLLDLAAAVALAQARATRPFSQIECRTYLQLEVCPSGP